MHRVARVCAGGRGGFGDAHVWLCEGDHFRINIRRHIGAGRRRRIRLRRARLVARDVCREGLVGDRHGVAVARRVRHRAEVVSHVLPRDGHGGRFRPIRHGHSTAGSDRHGAGNKRHSRWQRVCDLHAVGRAADDLQRQREGNPLADSVRPGGRGFV